MVLFEFWKNGTKIRSSWAHYDTHQVWLLEHGFTYHAGSDLWVNGDISVIVSFYTEPKHIWAKNTQAVLMYDTDLLAGLSTLIWEREDGPLVPGGTQLLLDQPDVFRDDNGYLHRVFDATHHFIEWMQVGSILYYRCGTEFAWMEIDEELQAIVDLFVQK